MLAKLDPLKSALALVMVGGLVAVVLKAPQHVDAYAAAAIGLVLALLNVRKP